MRKSLFLLLIALTGAMLSSASAQSVSVIIRSIRRPRRRYEFSAGASLCWPRPGTTARSNIATMAAAVMPPLHGARGADGRGVEDRNDMERYIRQPQTPALGERWNQRRYD